jgi:hypothetical protein
MTPTSRIASSFSSAGTPATVGAIAWMINPADEVHSTLTIHATQTMGAVRSPAEATAAGEDRQSQLVLMTPSRLHARGGRRRRSAPPARSSELWGVRAAGRSQQGAPETMRRPAEPGAARSGGQAARSVRVDAG